MTNSPDKDCKCGSEEVVLIQDYNFYRDICPKCKGFKGEFISLSDETDLNGIIPCPDCGDQNWKRGLWKDEKEISWRGMKRIYCGSCNFYFGADSHD